MKKLSNHFKETCLEIYRRVDPKEAEPCLFNERAESTEKRLNSSDCNATIEIMRAWFKKHNALTEEIELELFILAFGDNDARF